MDRPFERRTKQLPKVQTAKHDEALQDTMDVEKGMRINLHVTLKGLQRDAGMPRNHLHRKAR